MLNQLQVRGRVADGRGRCMYNEPPPPPSLPPPHSYNRVSYNDDSGEHRLELGTFKVRNLMPNTPSIYQVRRYFHLNNIIRTLCVHLYSHNSKF